MLEFQILCNSQHFLFLYSVYVGNPLERQLSIKLLLALMK